MTIEINIPANILEKYKSKLNDKLILEEYTLDEYLVDLIRNDLDNNLSIGQNFFFNESTKSIYYKRRQKIILTKLELALIELFLQNEGEILSITELSKAWGKRNVSIFTIRNIIKSIRKKTYSKIIKNYSNKGYSINTDTVLC